MKVDHLIEPVFDSLSEILILGSFPSVKSRQGMFYYHHPQNRFWKVMAHIYNEEALITIDDKKSFLSRHHIALWDVIASCEIEGSSYSSIHNVTVNDLLSLINQCPIKHIYTNGNLANRLYHRHFNHLIDLPVTKLPSTSPANASYSLDKLISYWEVIAN